MSAARAPLTAEDVRDAVVALYLQTGDDVTVKDIAASIGCSEAQIRRVFSANGGSVSGIGVSEESRPSMSRNYRRMQSGTHRVSVYGPTRETLRYLLVEAAKAAGVNMTVPS